MLGTALKKSEIYSVKKWNNGQEGFFQVVIGVPSLGRTMQAYNGEVLNKK